MLRTFATLLLAATILPLAACDTGDPVGDEIRTVFLTEITVNDAPLFMEDGERWDGGIVPTGPDIYPVLVNNATGNPISISDDPDEIGLEGFQAADVDNDDFPLVWRLGEGDLPAEVRFTRFTEELAIDLYDEDVNTDDFMGSTRPFRIADLIDDGAPNFITLSSKDGEIQVALRFRYER